MRLRNDVILWCLLTNHSLRATGTTICLMLVFQKLRFRKGMDIYKSLDALRTYERVTVHQEKAIANVHVLVVKQVPSTATADEDFIDDLPPNVSVLFTFVISGS